MIEHPHVQHFVMKWNKMGELSLSMTSLVHASIDKSFVGMLRVRHREEVFMEYTFVHGERRVRTLIIGGEALRFNFTVHQRCTLKVV